MTAAQSTPQDRFFFQNVDYGRANGVPLQLDARIPGTGPGPFPAVIIVHGGGWVMGDRKNTVQPLFEPLETGGFAWFSISYRLAGNSASGSSAAAQGLSSLVTMGAAVEDVKQAVAYVKSHAAQYHVDPNRIALVGESAGAQLASMAALKPDEDGAVQAVVALYAPTDLLSLAETSKQIPDSIRHSISGTPWEAMIRQTLHDISPIYAVSKNAPPFLLIHGTEDALVPFRQSTAFCERLRAVGGNCEIVPVRGGGHGIRWWEYQGRTSYKAKMVKWLDGVLAPKTVHHS